ncbi:MAG: hypothetical protein ACP5K8_09275 [Nitrososphaeria archaeon]
MNNQDRELQIKLAKLQANIQIYISCAFGFLAGFLSVVIIGVQIYFSLPIEAHSVFEVNLFFLIAFISCIILCVYFSGYYIVKAIRARDEIEELKKEYCW